MQILLNHKAEINILDFSGRTPIMYAAANGNIGAVGEVAFICISDLVKTS